MTQAWKIENIFFYSKIKLIKKSNKYWGKWQHRPYIYDCTFIAKLGLIGVSRPSSFISLSSVSNGLPPGDAGGLMAFRILYPKLCQKFIHILYRYLLPIWLIGAYSSKNDRTKWVLFSFQTSSMSRPCISISWIRSPKESRTPKFYVNFFNTILTQKTCYLIFDSISYVWQIFLRFNAGCMNWANVQLVAVVTAVQIPPDV